METPISNAAMGAKACFMAANSVLSHAALEAIPRRMTGNDQTYRPQDKSGVRRIRKIKVDAEIEIRP
jgi:hypothetical protein